MIERFEDWGSEAPRPSEYHEFDTDSDLAAFLTGHQGDKPSIVLTGGDLWKTLGEPPAPSERCRLAPCDALYVSCDGESERIAIAHLVAHRPFWRGQFALAMNAAWIGDWYAGPRAHPNDGLVDTTAGSLGLRQRLEARRRIPSGTHLPHPDLATDRSTTWYYEFERATSTFLDGVAVGSFQRLEVRVAANEFTLVI